MRRGVCWLLFGLLLLLAACTLQSHAAILTYNASCVTNVSTYEVRGISMSGLVEQGTTVRVLEGYQRCNNLSRGDIVAYRYAGNDAPLLKIVKAIPGDTWRLDGCNLLVNNATLATANGDGAQGAPYCIGDTRRLRLYVDDYPTIPENSYLLMGNQPGGSLDGSVFGLVSGEDIVGLAVVD